MTVLGAVTRQKGLTAGLLLRERITSVNVTDAPTPLCLGFACEKQKRAARGDADVER